MAAYKREMEPSSTLPPGVLDVIRSGGIVLTGNQRAARTLRLAYDRDRRRSGLHSWQPPAIFAWETWTAQLWHGLMLEGAVDRLLLNGTQELHVWRTIIAADPAHSSLQSNESLAAMASNAWQLLCAYRGQSRLRDLGVSEDTRTFQRWAQSFLTRCRAAGYFSGSELEAALVASRAVLAVNEILLTGFDSMTPAQAALLSRLRGAGAQISELPLLSPATDKFLAVAEDEEFELSETAARIRAFLETNPAARIAVIHTDIAAERGDIERFFRPALAPELDDIRAGDSAGPYEFSLGQPLTRNAMIASALSILRLATGSIGTEEVSRLLLSPWFTPPTEIEVRAVFDAQNLRTTTLLHPELSLSAMLRIAEKALPRRSPLRSLVRQLHSLRRAAERTLSDPARQKPYAEWTDNVRELLRAAEWATFARDTSVEFQTRRKWESTLDELASLDFEGARPVFSEVLRQLQSILERTLFAPESRDAPIQIMSPQEAAGSRFDAIFFLRCSDLAWPPLSGTNPLLGWKLQRELAMPGGDPVLDTANAAAITRRLASSTPHIVYSYGKQTEDGHLRPSPLLASLRLRPASEMPPMVHAPAVPLEQFADAGEVPLRNSYVRGGSSVLKSQAACGFRAFAEARLASRPLDAPVPGLDAGERGTLVHATMARLWEELQTQAALRALSLPERRATVDRAITYALSRVADPAQLSAVSWDPAYLEVQRELLHRIVGRWLESELTRSPFAIKALEQKVSGIAIGPLTLDVRIDRIDMLLDDDGSAQGEVLLDYKTSDAVTSHWEGDRPDDPQLPLYATLAEPGALAGVGFVRLRPGKGMSVAGYASEPGNLLDAPVPSAGSLEVRVETWREVLTALAEDFARGDARVRPKKYPSTCLYCAQRILCRVDPESLERSEEEDEDDLDLNAAEEDRG